ncbi:hypothetical protein V6N13_004228 [Hibiscus sabdariffa]
MVDSDISGKPKTALSSQRLSPTGGPPDGLALAVAVDRTRESLKLNLGKITNHSDRIYSVLGCRWRGRDALAGCEDSQHLNSGVNIQFATTIVSPIHNVSYAPNSTIATESNKQQSVADNMSGLSKVRLVIAKQSDARMENAHEAVALQ